MGTHVRKDVIFSRPSLLRLLGSMLFVPKQGAGSAYSLATQDLFFRKRRKMGTHCEEAEDSSRHLLSASTGRTSSRAASSLRPPNRLRPLVNSPLPFTLCASDGLDRVPESSGSTIATGADLGRALSRSALRVTDSRTGEIGGDTSLAG